VDAGQPPGERGGPEVLGARQAQREHAAGREARGAGGEELARVGAVRAPRPGLGQADQDEVVRRRALEEAARIGERDAHARVRERASLRLRQLRGDERQEARVQLDVVHARGAVAEDLGQQPRTAPPRTSTRPTGSRWTAASVTNSSAAVPWLS